MESNTAESIATDYEAMKHHPIPIQNNDYSNDSFDSKIRKSDMSVSAAANPLTRALSRQTGQTTSSNGGQSSGSPNQL